MNFTSLIQKFPAVCEFYWNGKWQRGTRYYRTVTGKQLVDVRTILDSTCTEIIELGDTISGETKSHDETALACLREVARRTRYVSDITKYGHPEHWQEAPETFALETGDCEDGSVLLMKLMQAAHIPAWRRKLCCGWVKNNNDKGGHAYVIYLAEDFQWYVLDWCYWYIECIVAFGKQPHSSRTNKYLDIWFTFNEKNCWPNQTTTVIKW